MSKYITTRYSVALASHRPRHHLRDMAYAVFNSVQYPGWLIYAVSPDKADQIPAEDGPWTFLHMADDLPADLPRRQACLLALEGQGWCFATDRITLVA